MPLSFFYYIFTFINLTSTEILLRIISKGGLYSGAARLYIDDEKEASQFIAECAEQCHNKLALELWGEELVEDIVKYSGKHFVLYDK
ncbi:MAG: hypothetical protein HYX39_11595 [Bacteroidetes bacterium]|nr:hypothetical protein [Bacteroidota bacterium]